METLRMVIVILIGMGFIFSQQATGAEIKNSDVLIPPDNYIKNQKQTAKQVRSKKIFKKKIERRPVPKGPGEPDLKAELLRIIPGVDGTITIHGRITNIGSGDFISGPGQAAGQVIEPYDCTLMVELIRKANYSDQYYLKISNKESYI